MAGQTNRPVEPMLGKIVDLPEDLGVPDALLADNGYFSAANVTACQAAGIDPLIALGRQAHHPPLAERFAAAPPALEDPTPVEAMAHRLRTPQGRALYAPRLRRGRPAQADTGTGVRHHQVGAGVPAVPAAWA